MDDKERVEQLIYSLKTTANEDKFLGTDQTLEPDFYFWFFDIELMDYYESEKKKEKKDRNYKSEFLKLLTKQDLSQHKLQELEKVKNNALCEIIQKYYENKISLKAKDKISDLESELTTATQNVENLTEELSTYKNKAEKQHNSLRVVGFTSFALVLLCIFYVVYWGLTSTTEPSIRVEINIGDLIGGSLVGIGAALAGGAYAVKTIRDYPNQ